MSVLVTGGAGYIGSHVVLELLDSGEETVVLDNLSTGFDWAVPAGAKLVVGDVGDQHLVQRIIKDHRVNAIMHFAGSVVVPEFDHQSPGLLSQQYSQGALADRLRGEDRRSSLHLLLDGRRLWHTDHRSGE